MNIAPRRHSLSLALSFVVLASYGCDRSVGLTEPTMPSMSGAPATAQEARASMSAHAPDTFYDPPSNVPNKPGVLLRSELLKDVTLPEGLRGWRILYTTTINDETPATAVATVFAPIEMPSGPRPMIAWEHGTTGLLQKCMPSVTSAPTRGIPALERIVGAGWVIVATDYSFAEKGGPHPYVIGEGEARATLDSIRAARQMPEVRLKPDTTDSFVLDNRTVVWGHSQGGHSALWTGIVAPRYAPDIKILGVVAIAPAANMIDILERNQAIDKRLGPYVALAYSRFYPDVNFEAALRPEARDAAREIVSLCGFVPLDDAKRIAVLSTTFEGGALAMRTNRALESRLLQNVADKPIAAPVVIAQGIADVVVPPAATGAYVEKRCGAGQRLEYWTVAGRDHGGIVEPGTPLAAPLMAWTSARFADEPQADGCARKSF